MYLFPLFYGLLAFLLTKAYGAVIGDTVHCTKEFYGSPSARQCDMVLADFASNIDSQPRYFDEEQLRADGLNWPGVNNNYHTEVVQLPAYWSAGEFKILAWRESTLTDTPIFLYRNLQHSTLWLPDFKRCRSRKSRSFELEERAYRRY